MSAAAAAPKARKSTATRDLALLLLASAASVGALTTTLVSGGSPTAALPGLDAALAGGGVLAVAAAVSAVVWRTVTGARAQVGAATAEIAELRRSLATTEAIVKAEAQVLIYWERGEAARVMTHTLRQVPGLPIATEDLLSYGGWLDQASAHALKDALDALFEHGRSFDIILKTAARGFLEADGRAAGGRAVLRLRDVAGYRRDLARIQEAHLLLARDIRTTRQLVDALPHPVWLRTPDGRLSWVNQAYARAVEAPSAEDAVARQLELLEQRQRKALERAHQEPKGLSQRLPLVIRGNRREHDVIAVPTDGAIAAVAIDMADLETARTDLGRLSAAYDRTLDHVGTAVAIFDRHQRLKFHNKAYQGLWRLDPQFLAGGPTDGAILDRLKDLGRLPEDSKYRDWKAKVLECYATGVDREATWHLPDGRIVHVMAVVRPDGGVTYLYADETERIALERRYNALINVQGETLDSLKEGVAVFGTDGRLKLFNSALTAIWKLSRDKLAESPHIDAFIRATAPLFDDARVWARIGRAVTVFSQERQTIEGQMVRPDNSVIDFAATPLPDGATLVTFADVTDAKRYERALVERNEALVTADRLKSQFIGHVSYELRTPLNSIIGFSELLAEPHFGSLNDKQREYLGDIMSSSRTLLAIIDDILDLTTIDAGALELKLAAVDVREVIDAAVTGVEERARLAGLKLDIVVADDVAGFVGDEARVRQLLYNLLSNAVGFSRPGGTVYLAAWREAGSMVFAVQDQGIGIPKDEQARVFDRFVSRTQGSRHRGAGLGLSIVKSLVDLHGGDVELQSEPGHGTRITVRLPENGRAVAPQSKAA